MIELEPGDTRRAAALIAHFGLGDVEGISAIFAEANEMQRHTELVLALLGFYSEIVPELRTEVGIDLLTTHVLRVAGYETAGQ